MILKCKNYRSLASLVPAAITMASSITPITGSGIPVRLPRPVRNNIQPKADAIALAPPIKPPIKKFLLLALYTVAPHNAPDKNRPASPPGQVRLGV